MNSENKNKASLKLKLNGSGFSLLELLITMGLLSLIAFAIGYLTLQLRQQTIQTAAFFQIDVIKRNLVILVKDDASWANTVRAGSGSGPHPKAIMDCLKDGEPCTVDGTAGGDPIENLPFAAYDAADELYFDSINPESGLTRSGMPCSAYPSAHCPFRYELTWSANCVPGNCVNPQVKVRVNLLAFTEDTSHLIINPENYSIPEIFRKSQ